MPQNSYAYDPAVKHKDGYWYGICHVCKKEGRSVKRTPRHICLCCRHNQEQRRESQLRKESQDRQRREQWRGYSMPWSRSDRRLLKWLMKHADTDSMRLGSSFELPPLVTIAYEEFPVAVAEGWSSIDLSLSYGVLGRTYNFIRLFPGAPCQVRAEKQQVRSYGDKEDTPSLYREWRCIVPSQGPVYDLYMRESYDTYYEIKRREEQQKAEEDYRISHSKALDNQRKRARHRSWLGRDGQQRVKDRSATERRRISLIRKYETDPSATAFFNTMAAVGSTLAGMGAPANKKTSTKA